MPIIFIVAAVVVFGVALRFAAKTRTHRVVQMEAAVKDIANKMLELDAREQQARLELDNATSDTSCGTGQDDSESDRPPRRGRRSAASRGRRIQLKRRTAYETDYEDETEA